LFFKSFTTVQQHSPSQLAAPQAHTYKAAMGMKGSRTK